jgi:hypothetical protein
MMPFTTVDPMDLEKKVRKVCCETQEVNVKMYQKVVGVTKDIEYRLFRDPEPEINTIEYRLGTIAATTEVIYESRDE